MVCFRQGKLLFIINSFLYIDKFLHYSYFTSDFKSSISCFEELKNEKDLINFTKIDLETLYNYWYFKYENEPLINKNLIKLC